MWSACTLRRFIYCDKSDCVTTGAAIWVSKSRLKKSLHAKNFLCVVDIPSNPLLYGLYHFSYHSIVLRSCVMKNILSVGLTSFFMSWMSFVIWIIPLFMWMTSLSSSYHCIVLSISCLIVVLCHASCGTCRPVMMLASGGKQSSKEAWVNVSQCCSLMGHGLRPQTCFSWRACRKGVSESEDMQQAKKQVKQLALRPCWTRP